MVIFLAESFDSDVCHENLININENDFIYYTISMLNISRISNSYNEMEFVYKVQNMYLILFVSYIKHQYVENFKITIIHKRVLYSSSLGLVVFVIFTRNFIKFHRKQKKNVFVCLKAANVPFMILVICGERVMW